MALILVGYNIQLNTSIITYGEKISIAFQTFILMVLHWKYHPQTQIKQVTVISTAFLFVMLAILIDLIPSSLYESVISINIVLCKTFRTFNC